MTKKCSRCKELKPATNVFFSKHKSNKDGLNTWCKVCMCDYTKQYFKTDKGKAILKKSVQKHMKTDSYKQKHKTRMTKLIGVYGWYDGDTPLYIGKSTWLYSRICSHKSWYKNPTSAPISHQHLYFSLQNHPNASIRIIEECSKEILSEREKYYINKLKPTYNTTHRD
jgi:hypothetical protein